MFKYLERHSVITADLTVAVYSIIHPGLIWCCGLCLQVLRVLAECIEKEGYSYVVEDDLKGEPGAEPGHKGSRRR